MNHNKEVMFTDFKKEYNKIKGEPFWIIEQIPIYETIREPGGYDHLGCLPDRTYQILKGYRYKVKKEIVSPQTIHLLITNSYWLDEESANWEVLNLKNAKNN
jgi:hypothetical protein